MTKTKRSFWKEFERVEPIRTPDCLDIPTLLNYSGSPASIGAAQRWHMEMGCARCHYIMMLAKTADLDEAVPPVWRITGRTIPLAMTGGSEPEGIFPLRHSLDDDNLIVTVGYGDESDQLELRIWSSSARTIRLCFRDNENPENSIEWPEIQLPAAERVDIAMAEHQQQFMTLVGHYELELESLPGDDVEDAD